MKTLIFLVLAVLGANAASVKTSAARSSFNAGFIAVGDTLLQRSIVYRGGRANEVQTETVSFNGNSTTRITAVQAHEQGEFSQRPTAWMISGGIGLNNVTVKFKSAVGRGYYYHLMVWGRP
ncbi:uncharacterized protein LOC119192386 [Manduca sexta]|uniref:Salivary secreted peptide n=1 Tax=Manduca sexta TaxID=7130 RepID=A0A922CTI7_MANSE|nr:uncharacterized protein LOC119192386 [Manduca sexta]KAG6457789.1 hypothetical protein O3G_MSEX010504 [Manduca sexta]